MESNEKQFAEAFATEEELRDRLDTLLKKMGNLDVKITHGSHEYGKDIVFYSIDGTGSRMLNACVVKNSKISGASDDNHGARTVFIQVQQALDTPHINSEGTEERVSRVFIVSPYECSPSTMRSIQGALIQRSGQVAFLCGNALLRRFAEFWPEFLAFESTLLGTYVVSLKRTFDQEDPIQFIGVQHSLFADATKNLTSVYVHPHFSLLLIEVELTINMNIFAQLNEPLLGSDIARISDTLAEIAILARIQRSLQVDDREHGSSIAQFAEAFSQELRDDWDRQSEDLRTKQVRLRTPRKGGVRPEGATFGDPEAIVCVSRVWPLRKDGKEFGEMEIAVKSFQLLISKANKFTRTLRGTVVEASTVGTEEHKCLGIVQEAFRNHPTLFRPLSPPVSQHISSNLIERVGVPLFIAAPAGYGKTSFCRFGTLGDIDRLLTKSASVFPVYVALHKLSNGKFANFREAFWNTPDLASLIDSNEQKGHRIRLYLDGLDEVSTTEQRAHLMQLAEAMLQEFSGLQLIVTGRGYLSGPWMRWITRVELAEFSPLQVDELIAKWLDGNTFLIEELHRQLSKTSSLQALMKVPLLATLTISVYRKVSSLPENRLKLYQVFAELLSGGWDLAKNVKRETKFGSQLKLGILIALADLLHKKKRRELQHCDIRKAIEESASTLRHQWRDVLEELLEDGLISSNGHEQYVFSHFSFQEYFTANALLDHHGDRADKALKAFLRGDDWWREVLVFYLNAIRHPDETESWLRLKARECQSSSDVNVRFEFLVGALKDAWPAWLPKFQTHP